MRTVVSLLLALASMVPTLSSPAWAAGGVTIISRQPGNEFSSLPEKRAISGDGRYSVFLSAGTEVVPGQEDTNNDTDVFLYDRITGLVILVSGVAGSPVKTARDGDSPEISSDGRYVVFESSSSDLVNGQIEEHPDNGYRNVFLFDRITRTTVLVSHKAASSVTGG